MRVRQFYCNKVSSQNAPKLAILSSKIEIISGEGTYPSPHTPPQVGRGTLPPHTPPPRRLVPRARHDLSPHFLNRGYAPG